MREKKKDVGNREDREQRMNQELSGKKKLEDKERHIGRKREGKDSFIHSFIHPVSQSIIHVAMIHLELWFCARL